MNRRKVALILSFIYCGLGQIYNGQILKGIDFIIIYTALIVFSFSSSPLLPPLLRFLGLSILPFMWLVGMMDAYMYEEPFIQRKRWLLVILPGAVISVLLLWLEVGGHLAPDSLDNAQAENQSGSSEFFSVQVAAFEDLEKAEELRDELLYKRYPARVERPTSTEEKWYRVLIGSFHTEQDAITLAEDLHEREGLGYMIVHRRATEKTKLFQKQP